MKTIADTHCHTIASDHAYSTALENIRCGRENGMKCVAITDHAPGVTDSPHYWHFWNITHIPRIVEGVLVLRGAEVNIMDDKGTIDLDDTAISRLDWIIASFHAPACPPQDLAYHTRAYLNIAKTPCIDVIGHSGTELFRYDYEQGVKAFKEYGKIVEINNASFGLREGAKKNCAEIARLCKKYEVPVIVDSDAHFATKVGKVDPALEMLEEIDFPERLILNADEERFFGYIKGKKNIDFYKLLKEAD